MDFIMISQMQPVIEKNIRYWNVLYLYNYS